MYKLRNTSTMAVQRAASRAKEKEKFDLCIKWYVCPECSSDLSIDATHEAYIAPSSPPQEPQEHYICSSTTCDFKHSA